MARIPEQEIERLKSKVRVERLIESSGVALKKSGKDWLGQCPFHDDGEPSLVVTAAKNLWHCLGACQIGGTVIDWVMKMNGVSFRHAVELLKEGLPSLAASPNPATLTRCLHVWSLRQSRRSRDRALLGRRSSQSSNLVVQVAAPPLLPDAMAHLRCPTAPTSPKTREVSGFCRLSYS